MGYVDSSPQLAYFYNVTNAVGEQCPNMKDDVMMVQYMLHHLYKGAPVNMKPAGELTVDGICGPVTKQWIRTYQNQLYQSGFSISPDGRVDRIIDKVTFKGSISQTTYTLYYLNRNLADKDSQAYADLPNHVPVSNAQRVPPPGGLGRIPSNGQMSEFYREINRQFQSDPNALAWYNYLKKVRIPK